MCEPQNEEIDILQSSQVAEARAAARRLASKIGFHDVVCEEIVLAVSELASNLVKHTTGGKVTLRPVKEQGRIGIQVETVDKGPGIENVEKAMGDGVSTAGTLGDGLGAVNRIMDEVDIASRTGTNAGTHIITRRWVRETKHNPVTPCPLAFGAATRAHPKMKVNGDAFVIKRWGESALVAVIDGLGHGQFAYRAAQTARLYVERHSAQPLEQIFPGTSRACRSTRGVVMALARFDWTHRRLFFASVGDVHACVLGADRSPDFIYRRGIVGCGTTRPRVTEHYWEPTYVMAIHSDGLSSPRRWEKLPSVLAEPATIIAQRLLRALARDDDDATVVVVRDVVP